MRSLIARFAWSLAALAMIGAAPSPDRYAAGQVWAYHVRPGDTDSLLKIQQVDTDLDTVIARGGPVYHVSVIRVRLCGPTRPTGIVHLPLTQQALDASVTRLSHSSLAFPDASEGIRNWRAAQAEVISAPLSTVVDVIAQAFKAKGRCAAVAAG